MTQSTPSTSNGRPARDDEVAPSQDMQAADRANGEPDAATASASDVNHDEDSATLVTDDPDRAPSGASKEDGPDNDETGKATLVTDEPGQ